MFITRFYQKITAKLDACPVEGWDNNNIEFFDITSRRYLLTIDGRRTTLRNENFKPQRPRFKRSRLK